MYGRGEGLLMEDEFICNSCYEELVITHIDYKFTSLSFTCLGLKVIFDLEKNRYGIKNCNRDSKIVWVPPFDIDFSDKNNLFCKLKTYLAFS